MLFPSLIVYNGHYFCNHCLRGLANCFRLLLVYMLILNEPADCVEKWIPGITCGASLLTSWCMETRAGLHTAFEIVWCVWGALSLSSRTVCATEMLLSLIRHLHNWSPSSGRHEFKLFWVCYVRLLLFHITKVRSTADTWCNTVSSQSPLPWDTPMRKGWALGADGFMTTCSAVEKVTLFSLL